MSACVSIAASVKRCCRVKVGRGANMSELPSHGEIMAPARKKSLEKKRLLCGEAGCENAQYLGTASDELLASSC
jgi:hypothetical protein